MRRLAGAAAAVGVGAALAGNIDPQSRLFGTPDTLRLRDRRRENLLRLALAREEVPTGVWEESSALAALAIEVATRPETARRLAREPAAVFRGLGYDLGELNLDEPELRACLLLAEAEIQQAIATGDAAAFVQALRVRGIEPREGGPSRYALALQEALRADASLGLLVPPPQGGPSTEALVLGTVAFVVALVAVVVGVAVAVAAYAAVAAWTWVTVSGGGSGGPRPRKSPDGISLSTLALQSGSPDLVKQVDAALYEEGVQDLASVVVEAASLRGVECSLQEAERQVRLAMERVLR